MFKFWQTVGLIRTKRVLDLGAYRKHQDFCFQVPDNLALIPDYFRYLSGPYPLILPTIMYINTSFIVTTINTLLMKGCVYLSRASVNTVKERVIELSKSR